MTARIVKRFGYACLALAAWWFLRLFCIGLHLGPAANAADMVDAFYSLRPLADPLLALAFVGVALARPWEDA